MNKNCFAYIVLSITNVLPVFATESLESSDINVMTVKAHELSDRYGASNVLLVYDVDNTLLEENQDLGSDAWFNWQLNEINSGDKKDLVGNDLNALLQVQSEIFAISKMHKVDEKGPVVFNQLQQEGFTTLLLSSRGFGNRDDTDRELTRNGFDISIKPLADHGIAGKFLPYDIQHPQNSGLSQQDLVTFHLPPAQLVTYEDGLYLTSGQHKGVMLRTLLNILHQNYRAVLFIDDGKQNTINMHAALDPMGVDAVTIRYSKLDNDVQRFNLSDKTEVTSEWLMLQGTLNTLFP